MNHRLQNTFKKWYANSMGEQLLLPLVRGQRPESLLSKCLPDHFLYPTSSLRLVMRHKLRFEFDLSDFVDWYLYFGLRDIDLDCYFSKLLKRDVIIDIGANNGYTLLRAANIASEGNVIGFEPSSHNYVRCRRNMSLNNLSNCDVFSLAIGNEDGTSQLKIIDCTNQGMNRIAFSGDTTEVINMIRLDTWLSKMGIGKVDVIKMDVEGFEMEVLKGAEQTILKYHPKLFIEVNDQYLHHFGASACMLGRWLVDRDYDLYTMRGAKIADLATWAWHQDIWAMPKN